MRGSGAQVRALDTLARHRLSDRQSLSELARLFPATGSVEVQRAIAAVFIRADYQAIAKPEVARVLSQNRLKSPGRRGHHRHPDSPPSGALSRTGPVRTCGPSVNRH